MRLRLVGFLCLLLSVAAWPQSQRDPLRYIQILESAERVQKLQVDRVIETLQIEPGSTAADLGAGSGLFTRPLAHRVGPQGKVYAIDIDAELLKHIERTSRQANLNNIELVLAAEDDPRIPEPVDLILLCDTLHHIANQADYVKNLPAYLSEGGRIAIIDFERNWPDGHEEMQYSPALLEGWMVEAGFRRLAAYDFVEDNFFVIYGLADAGRE